MVPIRKITKQYIETVLGDYPKMDNYISERKEELLYPTREEDENVGGGKGSKVSKPQEQMIVTLEQDKRLKILENEKNAIEDCLDESDCDTRFIINELYFKNKRRYTVDGLIATHKINISRSLFFMKRDKFINMLALKLDVNDPV